MVAEMARQDQISADLANATTPGYKPDQVSQSSFGNLMVTDLSTGSQVGAIPAGAQIRKQVTDLDPQPIKTSDNPLDMAISGTGYFQVQTPQGKEFTRNGEFQANAKSQLVDQENNLVMGPSGQPITVAKDGTVQAAAVGVFAVPNPRKVGDNNFTGTATGKDTGTVKTSATESSGVDAARTIVDMMASLRAIEAGQKAIQTIDDSLGKANSVGNIRS
jgi:flagellar basal-body rod protein FlgF